MELNRLKEQIDELTPEQQEAVEQFVEQIRANEPQPVRSGFGIMKGQIIISDDFDEPLEDFKDYR